MTEQHGPDLTMAAYTDQLFFGIHSRALDPAVEMFVKKYVPVLIMNTKGGGWSAYPPIQEPPFITVSNTYIFDKHPFFAGNFDKGYLSITQKTYSEPKWIDNISDIVLWFQFSEENNAKGSFKLLVDTYLKFNTLKKITSDSNVEKAEFTDPNSKEYYRCVEIILARDHFAIRNISPGDNLSHQNTGYRMQIKIGNDIDY